MGITISGGLDPDEFERSILARAVADAEESFAKSAAEGARERGESKVDRVVFDITVTGDPQVKMQLDEGRIRKRANELLANP